MAVRVPGRKAPLTASTATCPPKRMVRSRVSSADASPAMIASRPTATTYSALVANRNRHFRNRNLADEVEQIPLVLAVSLDLEVIHRLQRLMVFLAEGHRPLGRIE